MRNLIDLTLFLVLFGRLISQISPFIMIALTIYIIKDKTKTRKIKRQIDMQERIKQKELQIKQEELQARKFNTEIQLMKIKEEERTKCKKCKCPKCGAAIK